MTQSQGITVVSPQMSLSEDGLWRPSSAGPVVNTAVQSFPFIVTDMDGQPRDNQYDVGADEISTAPKTIRPLTRSDVGPPSQLLTGVAHKSVGSFNGALDFWLRSNYPNPFNPSTRIDFMIPRTGRTAVKVLNLLGQEVALLLDSVVDGGQQRTMNFEPSRLSSGVYFLQLQYEGKHLVQKIVYAK